MDMFWIAIFVFIIGWAMAADAHTDPDEEV